MNVSAFDPQSVAVTILGPGRASLDITDKGGSTVLIAMPMQDAQELGAVWNRLLADENRTVLKDAAARLVAEEAAE